MNDWLNALQQAEQRGAPCVLVTVADTRGSTPREVGAKMLVTATGTEGTVGGGQLEYKAIATARELLAECQVEAKPSTLRRFPLGPSLAQCCGGVAVLLFEPILAPHLDAVPRSSAAAESNPTRHPWISRLCELQRCHRSAMLVSVIDAKVDNQKLVVTAVDHHGGLGDSLLEHQAAAVARRLLERGEDTQLLTITLNEREHKLLLEPVRPADFHVVLFGAGHVGKALVQILSKLSCTITWVDTRENMFPGEVPANVEPRVSDDPAYEVDAAPAGSFFLVMTHSHPLDQVICERILRRQDFTYCGLIGSRSKRRKFEKRLVNCGVARAALGRLTCPIGIDGISGKRPSEIAIAVAAELLLIREHTISDLVRVHALSP